MGMRLPNSYLVFQKAHHNMIIAIFPPTLLSGVIVYCHEIRVVVKAGLWTGLMDWTFTLPIS